VQQTLIYVSESMGRAVELCRRASLSPLPALLIGESGVGKERLARFIHDQGGRNGSNFVAINCTAIHESLIESELFGHERGSFTGAHQRREGLVARAHGGSLFLDEIGDMPMGLQAKLLRFLQEKRVRAVGASSERPVDVRIVSATNRSRSELSRGHLMRDDLFYRLAGIVIAIPPLRERPRDAVVLAKHFYTAELVRANRVMRPLSPAVLERIVKHPWPGNVRELEHAIARAVLLCDGAELHPEHLQLDLDEASLGNCRLESARREAIQRAWQDAEGNVSRAARLLGVSRPTVYRMLKQIGAR
jgi:two-component system NtrC family response regulator